MPLVNVTLIEGYDEATRARLARAITDAVAGVVAAPLDAITVVVNEVPAANYMRGGRHRMPAPPRPVAEDVVRAYLDAMEARDLDRAQRYLADGFTMTFPGGATFATPQELVAWAQGRYRWVKKRYGQFTSAPAGDGSVVVCCTGTLHGEWPDGTPFSGIRFVDLFRVADGRLVRQEVWNDLAESRALKGSSSTFTMAGSAKGKPMG